MTLASSAPRIAARPAPAAGPGRPAPGRWPVIPAQVAEQLRPLLPELVPEMVAEIQATVPEYARPDDRQYMRALHRGAEAQVALRWLTRASQRMDAPVETLGSLAEALLAFLDEIAALSAEGYARAQDRVAGDMQRRRQRLAGLLLEEAPA